MLVTFYTRQFGKMTGMVKGARQAKSKYGSALQPMSCVAIVAYKKEGREIQTVSQCDVVKPLRHLSEDIEKMSVGMSMIELISHIAHEEEENIPLFELLVESLSAVNGAGQHPVNILYRFELRLAALLGFTPSFQQCLSCKEQIAISNGYVMYDLSRGGPVCGKCARPSGNVKRITAETFNALRRIVESSSTIQLLDIQIDTAWKDEIENFLRTFLKLHVSGIRAMKTERVFSKIMGIS